MLKKNKKRKKTNQEQIKPELESSRRQFLYRSTGSFVVIGAAFSAWPFVSSLAPAKDVLADAKTEVDLSKIKRGESVTVQWRGRPVFVRHRTEKEILEAEQVKDSTLVNPQKDSERVINSEWLIVVGVCTHLGCIPLGQKKADFKGDYGGWFCPCHGSHYDTSGRVRKGPAPDNLKVPPYEFLERNKIIIG